MQHSLKVSGEKCIHCGLCLKDCLLNCLEFSESNIPQFSEGGRDRCVGCQHCLAVCPAGALSLDGKNPEDSLPVSYGSSEELLKLIKSRRSVRFFKNKDISADLLGNIQDMLAYPPTGGNVPSLHFSLVGSKEKMNEIVRLSYEKLPQIIDKSPFFKVFCDGFQNGQDMVFRQAPSMAAVAVDKSKTVPGCENADPIIALSYLELYAQSLGLGTLWCDAAVLLLEHIPEALALLEIPEGYSLNYVLLLGEPALKYQRTVQKTAASVTVL